jgi:uncharacterized protein YegL
MIPSALVVLFLGGAIFMYGPRFGGYSITADTVPSAISTSNTCGMDISLVMDLSGSISGEEREQMKTAMKNFVDAFLPSTLTEFSIVTFSDSAIIRQAFTSDPTTIKNSIDSISSTGGSTNWEDGLIKASATFDPRPAKGNMILFASDGEPNMYNKTDGSPTGSSTGTALAKAVAVANTIKAGGTKIIGVAIGSGANINNFKQITGPNVSPNPVPMGPTTDIISTNFSAMSVSLASLYTAMCSNSIVVQNQIDTNGDGVADIDGSSANTLLSGYEFALSGPTATPKQSTDQTGTFQYASLSAGSYTITETPPVGYALASISCYQDNVAVGDVNLSNNSVSGISITQGDNAYCIFLNKARIITIGLNVSASPTGVPIGGGMVTYTYHVSNPSLVDLENVSVADGQCSPVVYQSGDTNGDAKLQNSERWSFVCSRRVTTNTVSNAVATGYYDGQAVTAPGNVAVTVIPAGPPNTGTRE